ncbi:glutaminyl-peptide cyclotransferase [Fontimonas sp. SYSU GA230001]|uniref:glutaminyl-peptide cyclotransferase n=1 Tax=Fontimonas sp. SYSU GA230001 TaxID=3142450 RepID=UPI0032B3117A
MHRFVVVLALTCACAITPPRAHGEAAQTLSWRVIRTLPHDVSHFTQGLEIHRGRLLESVGRYGRSALYEKSLDTGAVMRQAPFPRDWFAEGVTVAHDRIIVITWLEQIAQVFDLDLRPVAQLRYSGEGWGLTHDGTHLIMSDGSATIRFRNAGDFSVAREIVVKDGAQPVTRLNELEYARGRIYANVWMSDRVAVIDPRSGRVDAWLDFAALRLRLRKPPGWDEREHVLNGIAYDTASDHFYLTGKCWPSLFEVALDALPAQSGNKR